MKKILVTLILALMLSALFIPTVAFADSVEPGEYNVNYKKITINSDGGTEIPTGGLVARITAANGGTEISADQIEQLFIESSVSGTLNQDDVDYIGRCENIRILNVATSITIPESVVCRSFVIGEPCGFLPDVNAMGGSLKEITFPGINFQECGSGDGPFDGQYNLTTVNLPNAKTFGDCAFQSCVNITDICLPNVESFGKYAFNNCTGLATIEADDLPKVGCFDNLAFQGCSSLTKVVLPSVTNLYKLPYEKGDGEAFKDCTSLTEVNIPKIEYLGYYPFAGCESNKMTLTMGSTVPFNDEYFGTNNSESILYVPESADITSYDEDIDTYAGDFTTDDGKWRGFTLTVAPSPPEIDSTTPADDASNVSPSVDLKITFNENVYKGDTGDIVLHIAGESDVTIPVTSANVTISGKVVTIDPTDNMPAEKNIYVTIDDTCFEDDEETCFEGIDDSTTWNFATAKPPKITSTSPSDGATGVEADSELTITFDEVVRRNSSGGSIGIYKKSDDTLVTSIWASQSTKFEILGNVVTLKPNYTWPAEEELYITIDNNIFKNNNNVFFGGVDDKETWNFTIAPPPEKSSTVPTNGAVDVVPNSNLKITFDKDVVAGSGEILLVKRSPVEVIQSFQASNTSIVTIDGAVVTINPLSDLPPNTEMYVEIRNDAFRDTHGSKYPGFSDDDVWNFTTADAPQLSSTDPANGDTGVLRDANLTATFDQAISKGASGNIVLKKASNDDVVETIAVTSANVTISDKTVTITPTKDMPFGEEIYVNIDSTAFKNSSNVNFGGISDKTTWKFTTIYEPPVISSTTPADNATGVAIDTDLEITFNENILESNGTITVKKSEDNTVVETLIVEAANANADVTVSNKVATTRKLNLDYETNYYVEISANAFENTHDVFFAGIDDNTTWNFKTTYAPPEIASNGLSPADKATGVGINSNLTISFNENITKGTGNIILKKVDGDGVVGTIDVTSSMVTISGNTVTINPPSSMPSGTDIYVVVPKTAFKNSNNAYFEGIEDKTTWSFQTDFVPPVMTSTVPADDATGVSSSSDLKITFNENVTADSGNIVIYKSDGAEIETIGVTSANVTGSDSSTITINPTNDLPSNTAVYVTIPATAFKNSNDKYFAGFSDKTTWNFTIEKLPSKLSGLSVRQGPLSPSFDADTTSYTLNVGYEIDAVDITPSADSEYTITVNNESATSGKENTVNLSYGENHIKVKVSRPGYADREYTVTVTRTNSPDFTITYETKEGSGSETQTDTYGTVTLSDGSKFKSEGRIIDGWSILGTTYQLGALYKLQGDVTALAIWVDDTDGDGISDEDETLAGSNPKDASDEPQTGTVVLTLLDASGNPMANRTAVLNSEPVESQTDSNGQAVFAGVALAPHTLSVRDGSTQLGSYSLDFTRTGSDTTGVDPVDSEHVISTVSSSFLTLNIILQGNGNGVYLIDDVYYVLRSDGTYGIVANPKTGDDSEEIIETGNDIEENPETGYSGFVDKIVKLFRSFKK